MFVSCDKNKVLIVRGHIFINFCSLSFLLFHFIYVSVVDLFVMHLIVKIIIGINDL